MKNGVATLSTSVAVAVIWGYFSDLRNGQMGWFVGRLIFVPIFTLAVIHLFQKSDKKTDKSPTVDAGTADRRRSRSWRSSSHKGEIMKPSVAIALIIMGASVIMTPPVSDYLHTREVTRLLSQGTTGRVTLGGRMSETYRLGCWTAGLFMVGFSVFSSMRRKPDSRDSESGQ